MESKRLLLGLVVTGIIFTETGTGFANENPYADVLKTDWSYSAVAQLVHEGMVSGCTDEDFRQAKRMTKNDLAVYIAQAMSRRDTMTDEEKANIDRLSKEYAHELRVIGVIDERMPQDGDKSVQLPAKTSFEKKLERFNLTGSGRIRYDGGWTSGSTRAHGMDHGEYSPNDHINLDLNYSYKVNDDWTLIGESEWGHNLNRYDRNQELQYSLFEKMYLTGPVGSTVIKAGRYNSISPMGLVYDEKINGLSIQFGKVLKTTVDVGKVVASKDGSKETGTYGDYTYDSPHYQSILFDMPVSKATNLHAGYYHIGGTIHQDQDPGKYVNYVTLAADSKLSKNLRLDVAYVHSDAQALPDARLGTSSTKKNAYLLKLTYRNANLSDKGSFDIFALYRYSPQLASFSNTDDWNRNIKGIRIGGDYVFTKNMGLTMYYTLGKDIDTNEWDNVYRMQWNFQI